MSLFAKDYTLSPNPRSPAAFKSSPAINRSPYISGHFEPTITDSPDPKAPSPFPDNGAFAHDLTGSSFVPHILDFSAAAATSQVREMNSPDRGSLVLPETPTKQKSLYRPPVGKVPEWRTNSGQAGFKLAPPILTQGQEQPEVLNIHTLSAKFKNTTLKPMATPSTHSLRPSPLPSSSGNFYKPPGSRLAPPPLPILIGKNPFTLAPAKEIQQSTGLPKSLSVQRKSAWGHLTYEEALKSAKDHEEQGMKYPLGGDLARKSLSKASEMYASALGFKPWETLPLISKSRIVLILATHYDTPFVAVTDLRNAVADLEAASKDKTLEKSPDLLVLRAKLSDLLCSFLKELGQTAIVQSPEKIWIGERAEIAKEGLKLWEAVSDSLVLQVGRASGKEVKTIAMNATEALMNLATTGSQVLSLAPTASLVNDYHEIVELALDQASDMIILAKPIGPSESSIDNPFLTQISLLSCDAALKRHKQAFALGQTLDEEDLRAVIGDLEVLSDRERARAKSMRGAKAEMTYTSAFFALKQVGDAKVTYAQLLRQAWKKRSRQSDKRLEDLLSSINRITGKSSAGGNSLLSRPPLLDHRKSSQYSSSSRMQETIQEECEELPARLSASSSEASSTGLGPLTPTDGGPSIGFGSALTGSSSFGRAAMMMDPPATSYGSHPGRKSSWMPSSQARERRLSSIGITRNNSSVSAWNRKASVISLVEENSGSTRQVSTVALCITAFNLLEAAIKHYKVALNALATSSLTGDQLAQTKSELLLAIADASLFAADLGGLCEPAEARRESNLDTCGIYARWAAREVGMASLIEGTTDSAIADRKVGSWRAKEAGKAAIMTMMRMWWYKAATRPNVNAKIAAKEAVNGVLKRVGAGGEIDSRTINKYRVKLLDESGELNGSENMFWSEVDRTLMAHTWRE